MPAELPAEINRQVNKAIILLSQTSNPSDITIIVKQLVLAAIPIVAKIDAEIARDGRLWMSENPDERRVEANMLRRAILSRWKMED